MKACTSGRRPDTKGFKTGLGCQALTGAAWNRLVIDKRVQDNISEMVQGPKGVQRPEMDIYTRICGARARLWGSMR